MRSVNSKMEEHLLRKNVRLLADACHDVCRIGSASAVGALNALFALATGADADTSAPLVLEVLAKTAVLLLFSLAAGLGCRAALGLLALLPGGPLAPDAAFGQLAAWAAPLLWVCLGVLLSQMHPFRRGYGEAKGHGKAYAALRPWGRRVRHGGKRRAVGRRRGGAQGGRYGAAARAPPPAAAHPHAAAAAASVAAASSSNGGGGGVRQPSRPADIVPAFTSSAASDASQLLRSSFTYRHSFAHVAESFFRKQQLPDGPCVPVVPLCPALPPRPLPALTTGSSSLPPARRPPSRALHRAQV